MYFINYILFLSILGAPTVFGKPRNLSSEEFHIQIPGPGVTQIFLSDGEFIRKAIAKIPLQRFETYPLLIQTYQSKPKPHTQYRREHGKHLILQEDEDQREMSVIIMHRHEHLNMYSNGRNEGRTYIVLIQNVRTRNHYHALYCYVRNVPAKEKLDAGIVVINRVKKRIEWDNWEIRNENRNKAAKFGWVTCLESLLVPCKEHFPEEDDYDAGGSLLVPIGGFAEFTDKTKQSIPSQYASKKIVFNRASKTDYGIDFYDDLDDTNRDALFIGATIETVFDTHSFFVDTIHDFSTKEYKTLADLEMKALSTTLSKGFYELIMLDLKAVGNYSSSKFENKSSTIRLLKEGYRIMKGLLKNSSGLDLAMELSHQVFNGESPINDRKVRHLEEANAGLALEPGQAQLLHPGSYPAVGGRSSVNGEDGAHSRGPLHVVIKKVRKKRQYSQVQWTSNPSQGNMQGYPVLPPDVPVLPGRVKGDVKGVDWRIFCARPNLSPGEIGWCGCHFGKEFSFGGAELLADNLGMALAKQTVSNNPSILDPVFNTALAAAHCGPVAAVIDVGNAAFQALGLGILSKPLGTLSKIAGTIAGVSGGGPYLVANLAHQGIKVIGAITGLGGLIGMRRPGFFRVAEPAPENEGEFSGQQNQSQKRPLNNNDYWPNVETDVEIFGGLGWRTQDASDLDDLSRDIINSDFSRLPFVGFGNCPYIQVTPGDFRRSEGIQDVGRLFHTAMRTYCSEKQAGILQDIFDEEGLVLNWDKTISINTDWKLLSDYFLTEREFDRLSMAFSLSIFSQAYFESRSPQDSHLLTDITSRMNASNPAGFLVHYVAHYMEHAGEIAAEHYVKLTRDLVYTLKTAFIKALQDHYRVKNCEQCPSSIKIQVQGDVLTLLGLVQFVIDGQANIEHLNQSPAAAMSKFFDLNKNLLQKKLLMYTSS